MLMAIKNILVAYNGTDSSNGAVRLALLMAKKYDAHLTGVLVHGVPQLLASATPWLTESLSAEFASIANRMKAEVYQGITKRFEELTADAGLGDRLHWLDIEGSADATIMELARCFDITLMGEYQPVTGEEQIALHPDLVALQSGRPVLIVPKDYQTAELNEHAVLAWDGTRAASRALSDAMLILETKTMVSILTVGDKSPGSGQTGADIETQLGRHGIKAERVHQPRKGSIGASIVDFCRERGAGLLVMGAYEHSKFSEDLIGGVTNEVLQHSAIPVLMSH
jgi:nucleotide-binding universal stress UspA family protein